jgi:hypothetical protein
VAHVLEGVLDGFALGIEDGFLGGDDDSGLHEDGCRKPDRSGPGTLEDHPGCPRGFLASDQSKSANPKHRGFKRLGWIYSSGRSLQARYLDRMVHISKGRFDGTCYGPPTG